MQTLICGSLAFDTIMVFQDQFKNHILPDKIHALSVAFYVPEMRREFGGTAGNIAYNLQLLEGKPLIMATVGEDFDSYKQWLDHNKLNVSHIKTIPSSFTAQAFITTDIDDNQITAFHPGAMIESHQNSVTDGVMACFCMHVSALKQKFLSYLILGKACQCLTEKNCCNLLIWQTF